jgi:RHS repeat-associated protein
MQESVQGTAYTYDGAHPHRLTGISGGPSYSYDAYGRVTGRSLPNGFAAQFHYNFQGMIDAVVTSGDANYTYAYDTKNHRVKKTATDGSATYYSYDAFDNLIAEYTQASSAVAPTPSREYYYANGMLIGAADLGQWSANNPFACTPAIRTAGRATHSSPLELAWLLLPMSGCLILPRWRRYDARGKVKLTVVAGLTVVTTAGLAAFAGRSWGTVLVQPTYTPYWVHTDNLGSPIAMTNASGSVVWQTWYAPFGETADLNDDPGNTGTHVTMNIRRPGQYYDQETGLYYNWHRFYDPVAGRYLQADPIARDNRLPDKSRLFDGYGYADNKPLSEFDSSGNGDKGDNIAKTLKDWGDKAVKIITTYQDLKNCVSCILSCFFGEKKLCLSGTNATTDWDKVLNAQASCLDLCHCGSSALAGTNFALDQAGPLSNLPRD